MRLPWEMCKGPEAVQSFVGLRTIKRLEQSGLESKQLRRLEGQPRQALQKIVGMPRPGLVLRRIPLVAGGQGVAQTCRDSSDSLRNKPGQRLLVP